MCASPRMRRSLLHASRRLPSHARVELPASGLSHCMPGALRRATPLAHQTVALISKISSSSSQSGLYGSFRRHGWRPTIRCGLVAMILRFQASRL